VPRWNTALLGCDTDGTKKLPPLVTGKYNKPHCLKNKIPTKYIANSNSWTTSATFEEFLVQLNRQIGTNKRKILLFFNQGTAQPRDNTALKNIEFIFLFPNCTSHLQPVNMVIIHVFKCEYRKQPIRKAVAIIDR